MFTKGKSGNPSGRPKAAKGLRDYLKKQYGEDGRKLAEKLKALSESRNPRVAMAATELLLAYLAGKPVSQHEVSGEDGAALGFQITFGGRYKPGGEPPA